VSILLLYLKDTFISCNRPFFKIAKITSVKITSSLQLSSGLFEVNGDLNSLLLDCGFIITGVKCGRYIRWKDQDVSETELLKWKGIWWQLTLESRPTNHCMISWKPVEVHCVRWKGQKTSLQYRSVSHKQTVEGKLTYSWIWP